MRDRRVFFLLGVAALGTDHDRQRLRRLVACPIRERLRGARREHDALVQVRLGYPRMKVVHTSSHTVGQIFIPGVRNLMMVASVALVLGFRHSSNLAAAYGISVTGTMTITTILFYVVMQRRWGRPRG